MSQFYVSGVWKDAAGVITHLLVHPVANGNPQRGARQTRDFVVALIRNGNAVNTMKWNYSTVSWNNGAPILLVDRPPYLRTRADTQVSDNLDNMLRMEYFF